MTAPIGLDRATRTLIAAQSITLPGEVEVSARLTIRGIESKAAAKRVIHGIATSLGLRVEEHEGLFSAGDAMEIVVWYGYGPPTPAVRMARGVRETARAIDRVTREVVR